MISAPQQYLLRVLLFKPPKTVLHRGQLVEVVIRKHGRLRQLQPLFELYGERSAFWAPRTVQDRQYFLRERQRVGRDRKWRVRRSAHGSPPVWTGEARPDKETVPLAAPVLTEEEKSNLSQLGFPEWAMTYQSAMPFRTVESRSIRWRDRREMPDPNTVKDPWNSADPAVRHQWREKVNLQAVLNRMRTGTQTQYAIHDVVILGKGVKEAAEERGLNAKSLQVVISRVRRKMPAEPVYPGCIT